MRLFFYKDAISLLLEEKPYDCTMYLKIIIFPIIAYVLDIIITI